MSVDGDRRKFAREACLISAFVRVGSRIHEGTLTNISNNGSYFSSRRGVEPGTRVQVRFRHPWTEETVTARGIVMRAVTGPQAGLGIAMLDSLSDLEEEPDPTSGTFAIASGSEADRLAAQARARTAARLKAASTPGARVPSPPVATTPSEPKPHQMRPARFGTDSLLVNFYGAGRQDATGTLSDVSTGGLQIKTERPPKLNRLVRLEIQERAGRQPLRIAGKVTWSSTEAKDGRPAGFGVRILHFLSAADEQRWDTFLEEQRVRNTTGAYAKPG